MKSVYSAVRTESLNKEICASSLNGKNKCVSRYSAYYLFLFGRILTKHTINSLSIITEQS